jgi:membrane protease YdiL (CAAX protease family)
VKATRPSTRYVAAAEVTVAALVVVWDLLVPTLVILGMAALSATLRREGPAALGFVRVARPGRLAVQVLALTIGWTAVQLGLVMPVAERVTGSRQEVGDFASVQGDPALLGALLLLSWTLAAVGEEAAYRGYLFTRARQSLGLVSAVVVPSLLFGIAHSEQGAVGVVLTTLDAVALTWLRVHYGTLWAAVLGHGFNNTIGLLAYFLVGPVGALW